MTTSKENIREWIGPVAKYILFAVIAAFVLDRALAAQRETRRLLRDRNRLQQEIRAIRQQKAQREKVYKALSSDPFYVERVLRERYGYVRPGEVPQTQTARPQLAGPPALAPPRRH